MTRVEEIIAEQDPNRPIGQFDVVHFKPGGPTMLVSMLDGEIATCRWFDKNTLRTEKFDVRELRRGPHNPLPIIRLGLPTDGMTIPPWARAFEPMPKPGKDEV